MIQPKTAPESRWFSLKNSFLSRFSLRFALALYLLIAIWLLSRSPLGRPNVGFRKLLVVIDDPAREPEQELKLNAEMNLEAMSMANAGNSTLGFHSIKFVNLKRRYDRADAAALQAYLSGIDLEDSPAVEKDMIDDIGLPPTHRPSALQISEHGCWRAHANIWSELLRKKLPPVLIFESDATWDINTRSIMSNLNKHFVEFLRETNSTPVLNPRWQLETNTMSKKGLDLADIPSTSLSINTDPKAIKIGYNPEDPWLSNHWDILSLGHCFESHEGHQINKIYQDPFITAGKDYFGYKLGKERVIRKSGGITCTTAYAVSQTGAAKLLLRSAVDLDNPVDLLIRRMTISGDLVAYSVTPTIVAQWEYAHEIGMELRGAQSDIRGGTPQTLDKDTIMEGWNWVKEHGSVWNPRPYPDVAFKDMALMVAWERILGQSKLEDSQYSEATGN